MLMSWSLLVTAGSVVREHGLFLTFQNTPYGVLKEELVSVHWSMRFSPCRLLRRLGRIHRRLHTRWTRVCTNTIWFPTQTGHPTAHLRLLVKLTSKAIHDALYRDGSHLFKNGKVTNHKHKDIWCSQCFLKKEIKSGWLLHDTGSVVTAKNGVEGNVRV